MAATLLEKVTQRLLAGDKCFEAMITGYLSAKEEDKEVHPSRFDYCKKSGGLHLYDSGADLIRFIEFQVVPHDSKVALIKKFSVAFYKGGEIRITCDLDGTVNAQKLFTDDLGISGEKDRFPLNVGEQVWRFQTRVAINLLWDHLKKHGFTDSVLIKDLEKLISTNKWPLT